MTLNQYTAVLAGADGGHYTLPESVAGARAVLARVEVAQTDAVAPDGDQRRRAFVGAILAASDDGSDLPDPRELVEVDERAYQLWSIAVRDARAAAEQRVVDALVADVDGLIVEHLRPAHAEALAVARDHAALAPLASDAAVLAALSPAQRSWADALARATATYAAVRAAWSTLTRAGSQSRNDADGVFGELRDLPDVWPSFRQRGQDQPWPTTPVPRLCWVAAHATPWLPTVAEQEARWREVYGDQLDQARRNRQQLDAFGAVFA